MHKGENERLVAKYQKGDEAVLEELLRRNERLMSSVARHFTSIMPWEDLMQHARLAFVRAVQAYDPLWKTDRSTLAVRAMRNECLRAVEDRGLIRVPSYMHKLYRQMVKTVPQMAQELDREPEAEEIAERLGLSTKNVQLIMDFCLSGPVLSLEQLLDDGWTPSAEESKSIEDILNDDEFGVVRIAVSKLPEYWRKVIILRFGLDSGQPRSLEEVGHVLNRTREAIRQVEIKALNQLRKELTDYAI